MKIHLSLDDVHQSLLSGKGLNDALFLFLQKCHEKYGAKFSLYVQNLDELKNNLEKGYMDGLKDWSDWLRLGIHTRADGKDFNTCGYEEGKFEWDNFIARIFEWGGVSREHRYISAIAYLRWMQRVS